MSTIKIFCSTAFHSVLPQVLKDFQTSSGIATAVEFGTTNGILERLKQGDVADFLLLTHEAIEQLIASGQCDEGSLQDFYQTSVGFAIAKDAPAPNIMNEADFISAICESPSVAFTSKGASGVYFGKLIERLGIAQEILPKAVILEGGLVAELVQQGKAHMAVQLMSELLAVPNVQVVGPIPAALNQTTVFTGGTLSRSDKKPQVQSLCLYLASEQNHSAFKAKGLEFSRSITSSITSSKT